MPELMTTCTIAVSYFPPSARVESRMVILCAQFYPQAMSGNAVHLAYFLDCALVVEDKTTYFFRSLVPSPLKIERVIEMRVYPLLRPVYYSPGYRTRQWRRTLVPPRLSWQRFLISDTASFVCKCVCLIVFRILKRNRDKA